MFDQVEAVEDQMLGITVLPLVTIHESLDIQIRRAASDLVGRDDGRSQWAVRIERFPHGESRHTELPIADRNIIAHRVSSDDFMSTFFGDMAATLPDHDGQFAKERAKMIGIRYMIQEKC